MLHPFRTAALSTIGGVLLVATLGLAPAAASDHDGDADDNTETSYTEDTDSNDDGTADGVVDEGDNDHPSGRDRSVEAGGSGTQGRSESDPDDDGHGPDRTNGGPDKANGSGGEDLADQDGNNGCGNDDDFEDDNEGWCGRNREDAGAGTVDETDETDVKDDDDVKDEDACSDLAADAAEKCEDDTDVNDDDDDVKDDDDTDVDVDSGTNTDMTRDGADLNTDVLGLELEGTPLAGVHAVSAGGAAVTSIDDAAAAAETAPVEGQLPLTGANTLVLAAIAAGLLGAGVVLVRKSNRTTGTAS